MDAIKSMIAVFEDGQIYEGEQAWAALVAFKAPYKGVPKTPKLLAPIPKKATKRAYRGVPKLTQLPAAKENYRSKNPVGGRKAMFSQSAAYKLYCKERGLTC